MATDELTAKLITAFHNETVRVTNEVMALKERAAFLAGFAYGEELGEYRKLTEIQKVLGISQGWFATSAPLSPEGAFAAFKYKEPE